LSEKGRARELNKQSLIFQGIITGPAVMRCPVIIRRCLGVAKGLYRSVGLHDASTLIFNGHLMMIFEVFAGSSRGGNCVTLVLYRGDHQQAAFVESYIHISLRLFIYIYTC